MKFLNSNLASATPRQKMLNNARTWTVTLQAIPRPKDPCPGLSVGLERGLPFWFKEGLKVAQVMLSGVEAVVVFEFDISDIASAVGTERLQFLRVLCSFGSFT